MTGGYRDFLTGLHSQLRAGLPIKEALNTLALRGRWAGAASELAASLECGKTLAEALRALGAGTGSQHVVPPEHAALIEAGERAGRLVEVLERLIADVEARLDLRKSMMLRLAYPAFLYCAFVVLPPLFLVVTGRAWMYLAIVVIGFGVPVALFALWRQRAKLAPPGSSARSAVQSLLCALPFIGGICRDAAFGRAFRLLGMLLESGMGWSDSLPLVANASGWSFLREDIEKVDYQIRGGATATEALAKIRRLPDDLLARFASGENAGSLDRTLQATGADLEERFRTRLSIALWTIPILAFLMIALGVLIALVSAVQNYYGAAGL